MGYSIQSIGVWNSWTPTFTGFSVDPSDIDSRYTTHGKTCSCWLVPNTSGTSNATTKTVTLPYAAANTTRNQAHVIRIQNNGTYAFGLLVTQPNSNIANVYITAAGGTWTASGNANIQFSITYEMA